MSSLKNFSCLLVVAASLFLSSTVQAASLSPLPVEDAALLPEGAAELRIGAAYSKGLSNLFHASQPDRELYELPSVSLRLGLGRRVEGHIAYSYLHLQEPGNDTWGSGDVFLACKVGLLRPTQKRGGLSFLTGVKLPNANYNEDLGTDEADIYLSLLGVQPIGPVTLHLNLGMGILGDPRPCCSGQDDVLTYAFGVRIPLDAEKLVLLLGAAGQEKGELGINDRGAVCYGLQYNWERIRLDLGGSFGYTTGSEDWGVKGGLTFPFELPSYD